MMSKKEMDILKLELRIKKIEMRPEALKTPGVLTSLKKQLAKLKSEK